MRNDLLYKDLSYTLQGIINDTRIKYGRGYKEQIYQNAFREALELNKIPFEKEKAIKIYSIDTGKEIGIYRPDFIVDNKIIVEIKAVKFAPKDLENQLFDYLKCSKYELGYFINFGGAKLYKRRIIYTNDNKPWLKLK